MADIPMAPLRPWIRRGTRVAFDESTATDHQVVAAQGAGVKIRVLSWSLVLVAANTVTWKSATTAISGVFPFQSGGIWEPNADGYQMYETSANEALNLTLGSAQRVSGDIWYETVEV